MIRCGIGYPNLVTESTTIGGGSWEASFPANNVRTTDLSRPAVSTNDDASSTVLTIDWGSAVSARAMAIVWHNMTSAATVQWKRGTTAGADDVASKTQNAWQFTPIVRDGTAHQVILVMPASTSARHETISIVDESNPDNHIRPGHLWISDLWVPTFGAGQGAVRDELTDLSATERSDGGALWATQRRVLRGQSLTLPYLTESEGEIAHEILRAAGTSQTILWVSDIDSAARQQMHSFVGTHTELSAVEYPYPRTRRLALRVTEL